MSAWGERDRNGAHVYVRTSSGTRQLAFATEPIEVEGWWPDGQGLLIKHYWGYCNSCNADGIRLASLSINGRFADLSDFHPQAGIYAWSHHGDLLIGTGGDRFVVSGNPRVVICDSRVASCKEMHHPEGAADLTPAWSPDDKFIVFARGTKTVAIPVEASWQDSLEIWTARADGSGQKKLQTPGGSYPVWSSDGRSISFIRGGTWWRYNLYTGQSEATAQTVARTSGRGWITYLLPP
jgi:Tol biopolymer transport system component